MRLFTYDFPGELKPRVIEATSLEEAEKIADSECEGQHWLGSPLSPLVTEVKKNGR